MRTAFEHRIDVLSQSQAKHCIIRVTTFLGNGVEQWRGAHQQPCVMPAAMDGTVVGLGPNRGFGRNNADDRAFTRARKIDGAARGGVNDAADR